MSGNGALIENKMMGEIDKWWALQGLNLGLSGYEPAVLTAELRAPDQHTAAPRARRGGPL